jgi:uncharacterized membrane protein YjgN (DUF898 family)
METIGGTPALPGSGAADAAFPGSAGTQTSAATNAPRAELDYPVEFTASTGEYFRIWIVNLALTLLTLGIYSAWATVRKRRYFHGHTRIGGDSFEYLGKPIAILKGRVIAVVLFAAYSYSGSISLTLKGVLLLVIAIGAPWMIVRSLAFNAYNTRFRNIRFVFHGTYFAALKVIVGYGLLTIVTLFLLYPLLKARLAQFIARNHAYGATRFEIGGLAGKFFGYYLLIFGLFVAFMVCCGVAVFGVMGVAMLGASRGTPPPEWITIVFVVAIYGFYFFAYAYLKSRITNATWNELTLGPVHFVSTLSARDLTWIYFTNLVAVVCTVGLAIPWAVVRTLRYRANHTRLSATEDLDSFAAGEANAVAATGEEVGEMFGFDISL